MLMQKSKLKYFWLVLLLLALNACSDHGHPADRMHLPVAIKSGEECHLCGMIIKSFAGPKGELYDHSGQVQKFCSTRDMFSWYLQPENKNNTREIYVHDMGKTSWKKPDDKYFIPARSAWYVVGSNMKGAMGPTLAPFKQKKAAQAFISKYGGKLFQFNDITQATMTAMNKQMASTMGAK